MDRLNGDQTNATFGPEWLSFSKEHPTAYSVTTEDDLSSGYNGNAMKGGPKGFYSSKKIPLRFTRSKSTPLLPNTEEGDGSAEGTQNKDKKPEDVFTMLKERNSFDKNFPTLNRSKTRSLPAHATAPISPTASSPPLIQPSTNGINKAEIVSTGSAWKSSQSKSIPLNGTATPNGTSTSPAREGVIEAEIQLASCIVPNVQAPKVLTKNRVELLTKKGPNKKKFDTSLLRKATSEPNLPIPPAYQENYAKLMAARKVTPEPQKDKKTTDKPKSGTVVLNRSDFFRGIVNKKEPTNNGIQPQEDNIPAAKVQHRRVYSDDQSDLLAFQTPQVTPGEDNRLSSLPEEKNPNCKNYTREDFSSKSRESVETDTIHESNRSTSPKFLSLEDEEKFLRNLGWVPEEEDHVPELTEEEIREESNKLKDWMTQMTNQKKRLSLDVSILKKWQMTQVQ